MSDPGWRVAVLDASGEERAAKTVEGDGADAFEKRDGALVNAVDLRFEPPWDDGFVPHSVSVVTPSGNEYTVQLESSPSVGEGDNLVLPKGGVEIGLAGEGTDDGNEGVGDGGGDGPREVMRKTTGSRYAGAGDWVHEMERVVVDGGEVKLQETERLALCGGEPDWETTETIDTNDNDG